MNSMASTGDKKKSLAMWKFELSNEVQDLALLVGVKVDGQQHNEPSACGRERQGHCAAVFADQCAGVGHEETVSGVLDFLQSADVVKMGKDLSANVKKVGLVIPKIVKALGVSENVLEMIPAASDYVEYNQHDYKGEVKQWVLEKRSKRAKL
eukprot:CAMPEP_0116920882 /NCGR_PEP_ID=MMETSP0467-20121206/21290_1 /TAXON_ID=283647 /ORGANISM="Mesodinium pulex, Strain SPMC105" /LENGTH=151 /DNA_ID=CAMNT_0004598825 /DNA_START=1400 /DNA_END=1855 /DNA_ORIENTATION=+